MCLLSVRLHGSYEALVGGKMQDALVDMTAGVGEVISLRERATVPKGLFRIMVKMERANTLMGCAITVSHTHCLTHTLTRVSGLGNVKSTMSYW